MTTALRKNGRTNIFMTKSARKNVPNAGVHLSVACILIPANALDLIAIPVVCSSMNCYDNIPTFENFINEQFCPHKFILNVQEFI